MQVSLLQGLDSGGSLTRRDAATALLRRHSGSGSFTSSSRFRPQRLVEGLCERICLDTYFWVDRVLNWFLSFPDSGVAARRSR